MNDGHPLAGVLREAAYGRFPPAEGGLKVLPPVEGLAAVVAAFTAHSFIASSLDSGELLARLPKADLGAPMDPLFLAWLAGRLQATLYAPAVYLAALPARDAGDLSLVERDDLDQHPRVALALRYRKDVLVYSDAASTAVMTLGRGPLGLMEVSVEVEPVERGRGLGRRLAQAARALVGSEPVFAEIAPGNVASLRAFLAAGYTPICSLVALTAVAPEGPVQKLPPTIDFRAST